MGILLALSCLLFMRVPSVAADLSYDESDLELLTK